MRELTVRIRFTQPCLGSVPDRARQGIMLLPRNPQGQIVFLSTWHASNMKFAAQLLGRHQGEVGKIRWDVVIEAKAKPGAYYHRYYQKGNRKRFVRHEVLHAGQVIGVNCVVPSSISTDEFWELLRVAGQYQGISPYRNGPYGLFEVESILPRRPAPEPIQRTDPNNMDG